MKLRLFLAAAGAAMFSQYGSASSYTSVNIASLAAPDSRPCALFTLSGVAMADSSVPNGGGTFALPKSHPSFKEIYALLLSAKLAELPISVSTNGLGNADCSGAVGVTQVSF